MKVVSYNIRKAIGRDARRDPGRILDLVAALDADVVALQEADYRFKGRAALFDPDDIARRTALRPVRLGHGGPGLGWHGNVLLVRDGLETRNVHVLELPGLEPRDAVMADLDVTLADGAAPRPVRVLATHLGLLARYRRKQSRAVLDALDLSWDRATIVMGDFNGWGTLPNSLRLFEDALSLVPTGQSYPSRRPIAPLDRIYHDAGLVPIECGVVRTDMTRVASDHLPIWAEFRFTWSAEGAEGAEGVVDGGTAGEAGS